MANTKRTLGESHKKAIALSVKRYHSQKPQVTGPELTSVAASRDVFRQKFGNLTASHIRSILDSAQSGRLIDWCEFVECMSEEDTKLKALITKRKSAISSKELKVTPNGSGPAAISAAEFARKAIEGVPDLDRSLRHLLDGIFSGVAILETVYSREDLDGFPRAWVPASLVQVPSKRLAIGEWDGAWTYYLSNYGQFGLDNQNPLLTSRDKFIIHSPGDEELPHNRGLLRSLAFVYFFKKLGITYWLGGAEKNAFPAIYALVPPSTPDNIRHSLLGHLDSLSGDGAAVLNSDIAIQTVGTSATGGAAVYREILAYLDTVMSQLILGGTLVVEAASGPGGNRALGEVHERSAQEISDGDASSLSETLRHQLIKPLLEKNLHLFGGVMPPLPEVSFDVFNRQPVIPGQLYVQAGAVTVNELRKFAGLPPTPWGEERAVFNGAVTPPEDP